MPHIILKMYEGRSDEQKRAIAQALEDAMMASSGCSSASLSISIVDVSPAEWMEKVYEVDIRHQERALFKRPGYGVGDT